MLFFLSQSSLAEGGNPVAKIPLIFDQIEDEVSIETFFTEEEMTQFEDYYTDYNNNNGKDNNNNNNNNNNNTNNNER